MLLFFKGKKKLLFPIDPQTTKEEKRQETKIFVLTTFSISYRTHSIPFVSGSVLQPLVVGPKTLSLSLWRKTISVRTGDTL